MIATGAGVIDADYRGVVFILLYNLSDKDFQGIFLSPSCYLSFEIYLECLFSVEEGDRVAQLILEKIYNPEVLEVAVSLSVEVPFCTQTQNITYVWDVGP